jgi:hypothetical protein
MVFEIQFCGQQWSVGNDSTTENFPKSIVCNNLVIEIDWPFKKNGERERGKNAF